MKKPPHSLSLALPLSMLALAAVPRAHAADASGSARSRPAASPEPTRAEAQAVSLGAAWEKVLDRRAVAREMSRRGLWATASSEWRGVLLDLKRIEPALAAEKGEPSAAASSGLEAAPRSARGLTDRAQMRAASRDVRREAEREMKRAQSHLAAFWRVRDLVTPGVDSRNASSSASSSALASVPLAAPPAPKLALGASGARQPKAHGKAPKIMASASLRLDLARLPSARTPSASAPEPLPGVVSVQDQEERGSLASLRWARTQWWARPVVERGMDSRNPTLLSLPGAPLSQAAPASATSSSITSSALARAPRAPVATPPAAFQKPADSARRASFSWTMQLRLPTASEAAAAARRPLK